MEILFKRKDGSFVAKINGLPYHVEKGSKFYSDALKEANKLGDALQYEPEPTAPEPTASDYEVAIQSHIDATAREKGYRDGVTMASYVASTRQQWADEAKSFVVWRDAVWEYIYSEFEKFQNGERDKPTIEEFIEEINRIEWV